MKNIIDRYNGEEKEPIQKLDISKTKQQTQHTPEKAITNGRIFVFLIKKNQIMD